MPVSYRLIEGIANVFHSYKTQMTQEFAAAGIVGPPVQLKVLRLIEQLERCTGQMLAIKMQRDKAQITRLLQEMKANNLVKQTPNPNDKRSHILEITSQGKQTMQTMIPADEAVLARLGQVISEQESAQMIELLAKLDLALNPG